MMVVKSPTTIEPDSKIYRDPYKTGREDDGICSRVLDQLNKSYYHKCAYCEHINKLDIEHFRPKGRINDLSNAPISPGYFWLCYEWSNLLPACAGCNREGGKLDKFPYLSRGGFVGGPPIKKGKFDFKACRIYSSNLLDEKPVLLHPEVDRNFFQYFTFTFDDNYPGIFIKGVDLEGRGEKTIEICNLNRESLRMARVLIVDEFITNLETIFYSRAIGEIDDAELKSQFHFLLKGLVRLALDKHASHTLLRRYIVQNKICFKQIVLRRIRNSKLARIMEDVIDNYWQ